LKPSTPDRFGGAWTERKLGILKEYLERYTTALKKQPFQLWYVDAFAGTGYRAVGSRRSSTRSSGASVQVDLFGDRGDAEASQLRKGSARIALESSPAFDRYHFIDRQAKHCDALRSLRDSFPTIADRVTIECSDANDAIHRLCHDDWIGSRRRAVVFLDPFATQIRFSTLEAIAGTRAMDVWILFPLMAVNRMLTRRGEIPGTWRSRLDMLFGSKAWFEALYRVQVEPGLFGQSETDVVKARMEELNRFVIRRLKTSFFMVVERVKILRNSTGAPLFMLCFAASNPWGAPIAVRIADHLLKRSDF
jgi:three-Cys-motif partner protein